MQKRKQRIFALSIACSALCILAAPGHSPRAGTAEQMTIIHVRSIVFADGRRADGAYLSAERLDGKGEYSSIQRSDSRGACVMAPLNAVLRVRVQLYHDQRYYKAVRTVRTGGEPSDCFGRDAGTVIERVVLSKGKQARSCVRGRLAGLKKINLKGFATNRVRFLFFNLRMHSVRDGDLVELDAQGRFCSDRAWTDSLARVIVPFKNKIQVKADGHIEIRYPNVMKTVRATPNASCANTRDLCADLGTIKVQAVHMPWKLKNYTCRYRREPGPKGKPRLVACKIGPGIAREKFTQLIHLRNGKRIRACPVTRHGKLFILCNPERGVFFLSYYKIASILFEAPN